MIRLKDVEGGCSISSCIEPKGTPLEIARELFAHYGIGKQGPYLLIDDRSGFRHPLTKKGVPSKVRKYVREK